MNWLDFAIIGIIALSGLLAMARGMVRETLSLIGWVIAAVVTFIALPYAREPVRQIVKSQTIADIGTGIVIFLVVLLICALLTSWITRRIPGGTFGFVDGVLGLLFGLARGAVLVALAYLLMQIAFKENNLPSWVAEAKTRPWMEQGADILRRLSPEDWFEKARKGLEEAPKRVP